MRDREGKGKGKCERQREQSIGKYESREIMNGNFMRDSEITDKKGDNERQKEKWVRDKMR